MSKMGSHDPFGHFKHKLWPKEGPRIKLANLIPNHYKLGIAPISLCAGGMQHTIGKISMRATTLL
jgi:hypothetical protein